MTRIVMFDYRGQYRDLKEEVWTAVERVLNSGHLILGHEVQKFEEEFAGFLGGEGFCVGVNSGTDALQIALMALGISYGDEVITVANTAVPTVSAIRSVGATPVFCDVDPRTCLMDLMEVPRHITDRTRAVIPVHLFGNVVDVSSLREIIGNRSISIIEDCAQAHGATLQGRMAGTMGDIAAFSFYPTKNLGAYGDAGLCYSADSALARKMRSIRMYGFEGGYYSEREGVNSRMDEVQAAVLRVKLKHLPKYIDRRRTLAERYERNLSDKVERVIPGDGVYQVYHLFVVKVPNRDRVRKELESRGIETGIHYPFPIHLMRGYHFLGYTEGSLPRTEALSKTILSLPMYPELSEACVDRVCAELKDVLA